MFPFRHHPDTSTANTTTTATTTSFRDCSEEISVSNLRKLYSSLLEELAPLHHELGTSSTSNNTTTKNANYRWKNNGTITVDGTDDTGYDYSYTPDNSVHSWRLGGLRSAAQHHHHQNHQQSSSSSSNAGSKRITLGRKLSVGLGKKKGGRKRIEGGITGGDWSKDGVRRYHTGGVTTPLLAAASSVAASASSTKDDVGGNNINNKVNNDATDGVEEVVVSKRQEDASALDDDNVVQLDERFSIQDDEGKVKEC